jgi:hypothetical protein
LSIAHINGAAVKQDGNTIVIEADGETIYVQADTHHKVILHNLRGEVKLWASMLLLNNAGSVPLSSEEGVVPQ